MKPATHTIALALALAPAIAAQDCTPDLTSSIGPLGAFGAAMTGDGMRLAVGAPEPDTAPGTVGAYPYGRVELFEFDADGPAWQVAAVVAPPPSPLTVLNQPGFGSALALAGDTLLVGWPDDITGGNGSVRSFRLVNGAWIAEPPILPPFASATGRFGVAVAVQGDRCAIGEQLSDGLVHVFQRAPVTGEWTFRQTLTAPNSLSGTFGRSVEFLADWLFVGDPGHVGSMHGAGQVEVFRLGAGGSYSHEQSLVAPGSNPLLADLFGFALSAEGNQRTFDVYRLYVGTPRGLAPGGGVPGVVHEYRRRPSAPFGWELVGTLAPPAPLGPGAFGWSLDRTGNALLVGAPEDTTGPAVTGAAHLFERDPIADTWSYTGRYGVPGAVGPALPRAGAAVAIASWHAAVAAPGAGRVRVTPALPSRDVDADLVTDACEARFDLAACWLEPNSTGRIGRVHVDGSVVVQDGAMQLAVDQLTPNAFGYFILSRTNSIILPPGGQGSPILCLGGPIGRVNGLGQVLNAGAAGRAHLTLDPAQLPLPGGMVSAQPGETWYFSFWHRDVPQGSNVGSIFTETVRVRFE